MSWITNLAGKAEDILNRIDSEAAFVLTKEKGSSTYQNTIKFSEYRKVR